MNVVYAKVQRRSLLLVLILFMAALLLLVMRLRHSNVAMTNILADSSVQFVHSNVAMKYPITNNQSPQSIIV